MHSFSNLGIDWIKPQLDEERWEFFCHPAKQEFYSRHGLDWDRLVAAFDQGNLTAWPRGAMLGEISVELAYSRYEDYQHYLAKARRNYRLSYSRLETALQRDGTLVLKAPIILVCDGEGLLFSGWRRLCLAWNYGMVPYVWLFRIA